MAEARVVDYDDLTDAVIVRVSVDRDALRLRELADNLRMVASELEAAGRWHDAEALKEIAGRLEHEALERLKDSIQAAAEAAFRHAAYTYTGGG